MGLTSAAVRGALVAALILIAPLLAQAPPEIEVASLKPKTEGGRGFAIMPLPGGKSE